MTTPIIILEASKQPYLSIGRFYGGMIYNGEEYAYFNEYDIFLRHDWVNKFKAHMKATRNYESFLEIVKNYKDEKVENQNKGNMVHSYKKV